MYIDEEVFRQAVQVVLSRLLKDPRVKVHIDDLLTELKTAIGEQVRKGHSRRPLMRSK